MDSPRNDHSNLTAAVFFLQIKYESSYLFCVRFGCVFGEFAFRQPHVTVGAATGLVDISTSQLRLEKEHLEEEKGGFLYTAVSSPYSVGPLKALYTSPPGRPVQHRLDFSGKHSDMLQLLLKNYSLTYFHHCL